MYLFLYTSINRGHSGCDKPNGANTFLANVNATFINGPANLLNYLSKNPPDYINLFI